MADIYTITLPDNGGTYNFRDSRVDTLSTGGTFYGTCSTAAGTAAKVVTNSDFDYELTTGVCAVIRFDNDNTATGMTLNINSTGAKSVYYNGAAIGTDVIKAGGTYMFVYNGTQYDFIGSVGGNVTVSNASVTIAVNDWSSGTCTKNVTGVTSSNNVIVSYAPASKDDYLDADVYCSAQGSGTLTFTCGSTPEAAITVNVLIIEGGN